METRGIPHISLTLYGSTYFIKDSRISMLCVSSQGIWKILELLRFPQIPMIYDVDFPVDFSRKKIPDVSSVTLTLIMRKLFKF